MRQIITKRSLSILLSTSLLGLTGLGIGVAHGQQRSLTLRADIQEANAKTGVVTANGNVQLSYPARQIEATAARAAYFSRERRIVLNGNVYVLQEGNSLRAETVTYLIDEGRFVAVPENQDQVESIILIEDGNVEVVDN